MLCIRSITPEDLSAYQKLAEEASWGLTSLPKERQALSERIERSTEAFQQKELLPRNALFVFVAEESETREIIGTASICVEPNPRIPKWYYEYRQEWHQSPSARIQKKKIAVLHPVEWKEPHTEIGGLFVARNYRGRGVGKLLSYSRFLFMAAFPQLFVDLVISNLRGIVSYQGDSPFWRDVTAHFADLSAEEALAMRIRSPQSLSLFLAHHALYLPLLPEETQKSIGETYSTTKGALHLLKKQGFSWTKRVDPFDAGPQLSSLRTQISFIQKSRKGMLHFHNEPSGSAPFFIGSSTLPFRTIATAATLEKGATLSIPSPIGKALQLQEQEEVWYWREHG